MLANVSIAFFDPWENPVKGGVGSFVSCMKKVGRKKRKREGWDGWDGKERINGRELRVKRRGIDSFITFESIYTYVRYNKKGKKRDDCRWGR